MPIFEEIKYIRQVSLLPAQSAVNVQWATAIKKDGELVTETYERKAYTAEQYHDFLAEVEGAEAYIAVLGWTEPVPVDPETEEAPVEEPAPVEPEPEQ